MIGPGSCVLLRSGAFAEETIIRRDESPPGIVVPLPIPQPDRRDTLEPREKCKSVTVHRENEAGDSETMRKERCLALMAGKALFS